MLRKSALPWKVLFDYRIHGSLLNVSRAGLAVETRQAPSSFGRARLRVSWDQDEAVQFDANVVWCRMVGVGAADCEDSAPRYQVGLAGTDEGLLKLMKVVLKDGRRVLSSSSHFQGGAESSPIGV